VSVNNVLKLSE